LYFKIYYYNKIIFIKYKDTDEALYFREKKYIPNSNKLRLCLI